MKKIKIIIKNIIKGFLIGASILIPGLSGGTTAIILGVYTNILDAVDSFLKNFKKNTIFLSLISLGGLLGFYFCSFPIKYILNNFQLLFSYFVIGVILGSVPMFYESKYSLTIKNVIIFLTGFFLIFAFDILNKFNIINNAEITTLIITASLSAVALVLPGISLTNILIAFGYYDKIILSINTADLNFLFKFASVTFISLLLFTKILNKAYKKYPVSINMLILGMVIASIKQIFIRLPTSVEILSCLFMMLSGFFAALFLVRFKKRTDSI